jgi:hypothetical protein
MAWLDPIRDGRQQDASRPWLVSQLRLDHGLAKLGATIGAFIGELDLRHAPMRLDVPNKHRKPDAARANDEGRLDVIVMVDIGWHRYSPQRSIHQ